MPARGSGPQRMEGGGGRVRPPRQRLAQQLGRPPATAGGRRQGTRGGLRGTPPPPHPPLPPLSPPPARGRPEAGQEGGGPAAHPRGPRHPGGGHHSHGERSCAPSAASQPPTHSRSARCRPAAPRRRSRAPRGLQRNGDTQECRMERGARTKRPALVPARRRRGKRPRHKDLPAPRPAGPPDEPPGVRCTGSPPPPPRQADPTTAGQAAHSARGCPPTPAEHIYPGGCAGEEGGLSRGLRATPQGRGSENHGATPPLLFPPLPPPACGPGGRRPCSPPEAEGTSPMPPKGPRRPGRDAAEPARRAPPRPPPPAPAGAATGGRTRASAQGRHTDHARGRHANTNWCSMGATPSMTWALPMIPALLPAQGRQRDGPRQSNPLPR